MRIAHLLAVAGSILAIARAESSLMSVPSCALSCIIGAIEQSSCSITDFACVCNDELLNRNISKCVVLACSTMDLLKLANATATSCGRPVRNKSPSIKKLTVGFGSVAFVAVIFRVLARLPSTGIAFGIDDALVLLLEALTQTMNVLIYLIADAGIGKDLWMVYEKVGTIVYLFMIIGTIYVLAMAVTKLAMLFFYQRFFSDNRKFTRIVWGVMAFTVLYGIIFAVVSINQCRPISYSWRHWDDVRTGHCLNPKAYFVSMAGFNILLDVIVIGLPIPLLWKLKLPMREKLQVISMFSVAFLVTIVSSLRLHVFIGWLDDPADFTYSGVEGYYWTIVESNLGIVCLCTPSMRIVAQKVFPRWFPCFRRRQDLSRYGSSRSMETKFSQKKSQLSDTVPTELTLLDGEDAGEDVSKYSSKEMNV